MYQETDQIQKKFLIDVYTAYSNYRFVSKANAVTFINIGTINVTLNNTLVLTPGQSLSIEGNINEIDLTEYFINFGTATNGALLIIRKIYV
jgi:hypothetical protein